MILIKDSSIKAIDAGKARLKSLRIHVDVEKMNNIQISLEKKNKSLA
jgi:hypothetical protein